jgi:hypothetical protein
MIRSDLRTARLKPLISRPYRKTLLGLVLLCFGASLVLAVAIFLGDAVPANSQAVLLLALAALLAAVSLGTAIPVMLRQAKGIDLLHPLFYATWYFFVPQFVLASLLVVLGYYNLSISQFLPDPWVPRVTAIVAAIIGYLGLFAGFMLPVGRALAGKLPQYAVLDAPADTLKLPAVLFLLLGTLGLLGTFSVGLFGYQLSGEVSSVGGVYSAFSGLFLVSQGITWYAFFRNRKSWWFLALLNIALILVQAVVSGSRGALLNSVVVVGAAYLYAQSRPGLSHLWKLGLILGAAVLVGMAFGTTFRDIKSTALGRATAMNMGDVASLSQSTVADLRGQSVQETFQFTLEAATARIDGIDSLSVILTYADRLKDAEAALGIDHNISRDLMTSIVPRFLWPDKPVVGVHEQIGNLYFDTSGNSPATTYMGDLYRNFGSWGIFPGMLLLGIALRASYAWLIEGRPRSPLRTGLYIPLALLVNYESLYSVYFPGLIRVVVVVLGAIVIVRLVLPFSAPKNRSKPT